MDSTRRTLGHTFLAQFAFREIYIGKIVLYGNCSVRTYLRTFAAADAGGRACLAGNRSLILVDTTYIYPHPARTLVPQLYDILRAGLDTGSAGRTFLLIHFRKAGLGIYVDCTELTCGYTVSATQTPERASRITAVKGRLDTAGKVSAVNVHVLTVFTGSVAADHRDHRGLFLDLKAEHGCNLLHRFVSTDRTEILVQIHGLDTRLGESPAAGISAAAAVGSWKHLLHIVDPRIFLHLELCSHKIQDDSKDCSEQSKDCDCPDKIFR